MTDNLPRYVGTDASIHEFLRKLREDGDRWEREHPEIVERLKRAGEYVERKTEDGK